MDTWKPRFCHVFGHSFHFFFASLLLILSFLLLPHPVQAAGCGTYHWVQSGQTTAYIAHTYGFKWREIAEANGMQTHEKLVVGTRLCIPFQKKEEAPALPKSEPEANIAVFINGDRVYFSIDDYREAHEYRVKARKIKTVKGGWFNLGYMAVLEKEPQSFVFDIPVQLRNSDALNVCLKDMQSNELICYKTEYPS